MIELGVVDLSASARRRLAALVERWSWISPETRISVPRISLQLLSPEEIRFHGNLDVCLVGPELLACDAAYLATIRRELPEKLIVCVLDARTQSVGSIEQLGRLGVDDVLLETASSDEFIRRIVLLQRRLRSRHKGAVVVVDSARGGVGATFIAAAVAEALVTRGESVCLVDCDAASQDLTRFLGVKPCVSESLRMLLDQQRLITGETVEECCHPVWSDEPKLRCVPPPAGSNEALLAAPGATRALVSVIETLASLYRHVVVDASSLGASVRHALYQIAGDALFVVNRDPAGAFASKQALGLLTGALSPDARLCTIINDNSRVAAPVKILQRESLSVVGRNTTTMVLPYAAAAARWACSGHTPYSFLHRHAQSLIQDIVAGREKEPATGILGSGFERCSRLCRTIVQRLCWWREREEAEGTDDAVNAGARSLMPLAIGFNQNLIERGELVSKPVLLG